MASPTAAPASTSGNTNTTGSSDSLRSRLAAALPKGQAFTVYHLSTPPTKAEPLCSPPPGERPERTYCEKHFLAVSISLPTTKQPSATDDDAAVEKPKPRQVLVLALEVYLFTTARTTTLFVSKADSTGYLHLGPREPASGAASPVRAISSAFVAFLADHRRRPSARFVVSLFARAQAQYLFPGSSRNSGKHILDDRGLVRWWCRVLDGVLVDNSRARGYLIVPGLDKYETRAFLPRGNGTVADRWVLDHPLERISPYTREFDWVPPRCLIPRFPDDPKSRFRDELDEEGTSSSQFRTTGSWKSVRTLGLFWELMAYRQECSSGQMTGFIWLVFDDIEDGNGSGPKSKEATPPPVAAAEPESQTSSSAGGPPETPKTQRTLSNIAPKTTPRKLFSSRADATKPLEEKLKDNAKRARKQQRKKKKLTGPIHTRAPRVKTAQKNYLLNQPASTAYYLWSPTGRGERIVSDTDYKRIVELLLHLDFATLDKAAGSTRRWVGEASMGSSWGYTVIGAKETDARERTAAGPTSDVLSGEKPAAVNGQQVNNLTGLIKRKRTCSEGQAASSTPNSGTSIAADTSAPPAVNVLGAGLIRKKPKV